MVQTFIPDQAGIFFSVIKILMIIKMHHMIKYVPDYGYENDRIVSDRVHRFIFGKSARILEHIP